jgi:hypothetical protein
MTSVLVIGRESRGWRRLADAVAGDLRFVLAAARRASLWRFDERVLPC